MTRRKKIGFKMKRCLENDDLDEFGALMDEHWEAKKKTSSKISNSQFDDIFEMVRNYNVNIFLYSSTYHESTIFFVVMR